MQQYSQEIQDAIIDNEQFYGDEWFLFDKASPEQLKEFVKLGLHPLLCVYLPSIERDEEFKDCGHVGIPSIFQGIPPAVYTERVVINYCK